MAVERRPRAHPLAVPALRRPPAWTIALLASAVVVSIGRLGPDWPAQEFRAWLAGALGQLSWNDSWYSGHALPGYSVLYPALAAGLGAALTGLLAATLSAWSAARLIAAAAGVSGRTSWLIAVAAAACIADNLFIGQLPFLLGVAAGLQSILAVRRGRFWVAAAASAGCSLASPLAGLFLAMIAAAWLPELGWRRAVVFLGSGLGAAVALLIGGTPGRFPSDLYSTGAAAGFVLIGLVLIPRRYRTLRRFMYVYGGTAAVLLSVPNPVGGNVDRLARLVAVPLAIWVVAQHRPLRRVGRSVLIGLSCAGALVMHLYAPISALARASDDPSARPQFYQGLLGFLAGQRQTAGRLEIPFTREHWEAAFVAPHFPLARGWERQLDLAYDAVLYHPLTAASYRSWLDSAAVDLIAVPQAPLDYGGQAEQVLLRHPPAYLVPAYRDAHWQVFRVVHPAPLVSGGHAELTALGPSSFTLHFASAGTALIKLHANPMWQLDSPTACLLATPDGWLHVRDTQAGTVTATASVSIQSLLRQAGPACGR